MVSIPVPSVDAGDAISLLLEETEQPLRTHEMQGTDGNEHATPLQRQIQTVGHERSAPVDDMPREYGVMPCELRIASFDGAVDARKSREIAFEPRPDRASAERAG